MTEKISHPDWSFFLAIFLPKCQTSYPDLHFSGLFFIFLNASSNQFPKILDRFSCQTWALVDWYLLLICGWASVAQLGVFFSSDYLSPGPVSVSSWYVGLVGLFLRDNKMQWLGGLHAGLAFCAFNNGRI